MVIDRVDQLFQRVLEKNTFFFSTDVFEEEHEDERIPKLTSLLLELLKQVGDGGITKEFVDELLQREMGLDAILALNGLSFEQYKRIITFARADSDHNLDRLLNRSDWGITDSPERIRVIEWGDNTYRRNVQKNAAFRAGTVNLFFDGIDNPYLIKRLPPFMLKKLSASKLEFQPEALVDTLIRYKVKGSRSAKAANNPATLISGILDDYELSYVTDKHLPKLQEKNPGASRVMDFVLPTLAHPRIVIESSYQMTTSSNQGDKSKAEAGVDALIHQHYRGAKFIGFVDGAGWFVRRSSLRRMVNAYDDVFTFHDDELGRFQKLLKDTFAL